MTDFKHVIEALDPGRGEFSQRLVFHRASAESDGPGETVMTVIYGQGHDPENPKTAISSTAGTPGALAPALAK